jgi:hypothetical protein
LGKRQVTDLVEDQHLEENKLLKTAFQPIFMRSLYQTGHQVFQDQEEHRIISLDGFESQDDGQASFPYRG